MSIRPDLTADLKSTPCEIVVISVLWRAIGPEVSLLLQQCRHHAIHVTRIASEPQCYQFLAVKF